MELIKFKEYRFDVERLEEAKGNLYYVVQVSNKEVWIKIPDYQKKRAKYKKQIDCIYYGTNKYGYDYFELDKLSILNDLYEVKSEHIFTFISESYDNNTHTSFCFIKDEYGFIHRLYASLSEKQKNGKENIVCIVDDIDSKRKILKLRLKEKNIENNENEFSGTWFDADRLFSDISKEEMKINFFDPLLKSEDKNSYLVSMKKNYLSNNNLWIFSLLNYIDYKVIKDLSAEYKFEDLKLYTELVIDIQKWITEKSDFLMFFSKERRDEAILKSRTQLLKYESQLKAVKLILDGKQEEFIEDILSSLQKSKRIVWRRDDRVQTLLKLLALDSNILQHDTDSFIELIMLLSEGEDLLDDFNRNILSNVLSSRISTENAQLNQIMHYDSDDNISAKQQTIINIIRIIGSQVILEENDVVASRVKTSHFFRYMCLISEKDNHRMFLNLAIDSLLGIIEYKKLFIWDNIVNFNINKIIEESKKIKSFTSNKKELFASSRKGQIYIYEGKFIVIPRNLAGSGEYGSIKNLNILHSILNGKVSLGSTYNIKSLVSDGNILDIYQSWDSIIKGRSLDKDYKSTLGVGDNVKVVVKNQKQDDDLKNLLFVNIISKKGMIESCIHVTQMSSKFISDVRHIFTEGDVINAKILKINDDGKIDLTLKPFTDKFINTKTSVEDDLKSLVVENIHESKNVQTPMVRNILMELIYIFDMYIKIENDITKKFFYIMYNKLLTGMLKINDLTSYYTFILYYNVALYEFIQSKKGFTVTKYNEWYEIVNQKYPEIGNKIIIFKLIESISEPDLLGENALFSFANNDDANISKIAKLVLSLRFINSIDDNDKAFIAVKGILNNILTEQNEFINIGVDEIRNSLASFKDEMQVEDNDEDESIDSYGNESQTIEFKTSYIYYAGNSEVHIHEQSEVIMKVICGFLNADGGKIFIGVNDNGIPIGISNDLEYLKSNKDEYERRIRKDIVESFSKDINGLISINFDKNNVCIISVPQYYKPISLNRNFWQRQGNETRIITGEDLIPFILRRSNDENKENTQLNSNGKYNIDYSRFSINNKLIYNQTNIDNSTNKDLKILAYWNLFRDGSYIVMDTKIVSKDIIQSIPITNDKKKGYILQCYDNGCVNKYPIKNILDKKKGFKYVNGMYAYALIKNIFTITNDSYLIIKSEYNNETYIKIYNSSNITIHSSLHLKGNQIVDNLGDNISYYMLPNKFEGKLNKLIYNSSSGRGRNIDNQYYWDERSALADIGII